MGPIRELPRPGTLAAAVVCVALAATTMACHRSRGSEKHIIPEGFEGPVAIVYGVIGGEKPGRDGDGATVYHIPASGLLLVDLPTRESGWYKLRFQVETAGSSPREVPLAETASPAPGPEVFQAFGISYGSVTRLNGRDVEAIAYQSYVVGIPSRMPNWADSREALVRQGVTEAVKRRRGAEDRSR